MRSSQYFEQALFSNQSCASDTFFVDRSDRIFQAAGGKPTAEDSYVEIHVQPRSEQNIQCEAQEQLTSWERIPQRVEDLDFTTDTDASLRQSIVDQSDFSYKDIPPRYVGTPGLRDQRISDGEQLRKVALVRSFFLIECARLMVENRRPLSTVFGYGT